MDYIVIDNRSIAKGIQRSTCVKKLQPCIIVCIMIKNSGELIALRSTTTKAFQCIIQLFIVEFGGEKYQQYKYLKWHNTVVS